MAADVTATDNHARRKPRWLKLAVLEGLGVVLLCSLLAMVFLQDGLPSPIPEDCTRLEVAYYPSVAAHLHQPFVPTDDLFNPAEMEQLRSHGDYVISDVTLIEALSHLLRSRTLPMGGGTREVGDKYIRIRCYRGAEHVASLTLYEPDMIVTDDGRRFQNQVVSPGLGIEELNSFMLRELCWQHLSFLYRLMGGDTAREYPLPVEWCDAISRSHVAYVRGLLGTKRVSPSLDFLVCPGGHEGKCHYAMNPACEPNSPPDAVLVFETTGGWNQYGGPELFTFDNHSPRGGCVLLNNGIVKFIRTEEELKQLRWK